MTDAEQIAKLEKIKRHNQRVRLGVFAALALATLLCIASASKPAAASRFYASDPAPLGPLEELQLNPPQQALDVPFRVFKTGNVWNQLLLSTMDGRVWQISYTVKADGVRELLPINSTPLVTGKGAFVGRFTLYPTDNIWTFLLVDQFGGAVWQCQFGTEDGYRWLRPINATSQGSQ